MVSHEHVHDWRENKYEILKSLNDIEKSQYEVKKPLKERKHLMMKLTLKSLITST